MLIFVWLQCCCSCEVVADFDVHWQQLHRTWMRLANVVQIHHLCRCSWIGKRKLILTTCSVSRIRWLHLQSQGATLPHFDMDEFRRKMSSPGGVYKVTGTLDWTNPLSSSLSGDVELDLKKLEHKIQRESPNGLPPNQVGAMDWEIVAPITDPNADPVFGSLPYISPEEDPLQVWGSMARSVELKVAESERRIWQKFRRI